MTANENPQVSLMAQVDDHKDVKELINLTGAIVESYRRFYGKGVKKAAAEARKALQAVKVQVMTMRKQVQADKMLAKTKDVPKE